MSHAATAGESRWPAALAVIVAIVLQLRLPENLSVGPSYAVPVIAAALLVPLIIANPRRFTPTSRDTRTVSIALIAAMNVGNVSSLLLLLRRLLNGSNVGGRSLLLSAVGIWLTIRAGLGVASFRNGSQARTFKGARSWRKAGE